MDVIDAIRLRRSIRGYKPDPVPQEVLREILGVATRAPSANNAQPWEFTVVTGEVLDRIRQGNIEMFLSGAALSLDAAMTPFEGVYRQRQRELGIQLFQLMGIAREDSEKRAQWAQRSPRFFDAPAAIILSMDRSLDEARLVFDIGAISQTICLAALHYGLGTCIVRAGVHYPEVLRRFAGIPQSKRIVMAIAIGYPDPDFPANKVESKREPIASITTWHGFDP